MRIAILGWGSLIWEGGADFESTHGPWEYDGPTLKIEFCRISQTRLGALTLVVNEQHGTSTTVAWCLSKRAALDDAVCDLRCREGTTLKNISRFVIAPAVQPVAVQGTVDPITAWGRAKNVEAVIWTALESNFEKTTGQMFSVEAALSYISRLPPVAKVKAAEYVWRAPRFVNTPLRAALQKAPWF